MHSSNIAKAQFVLIKRGSESPHTSEDEESFIDLLNFFFIILLFEFLHIVKSLLVGVHILAEFINNGSQSVDLSELTNWSNMLFVF